MELQKECFELSRFATSITGHALPEDTARRQYRVNHTLIVISSRGLLTLEYYVISSVPSLSLFICKRRIVIIPISRTRLELNEIQQNAEAQEPGIEVLIEELLLLLGPFTSLASQPKGVELRMSRL